MTWYEFVSGMEDMYGIKPREEFTKIELTALVRHFLHPDEEPFTDDMGDEND